MSRNGRDWGWLIVAILLIISGVRVLLRGHAQHFLSPAFQASGATAKTSGVVCLILGAIGLIHWVKENVIRR